MMPAEAATVPAEAMAVAMVMEAAAAEEAPKEALATDNGALADAPAKEAVASTTMTEPESWEAVDRRGSNRLQR